jgi:quercetin dioxygenase-like cupin family protein
MPRPRPTRRSAIQTGLASALAALAVPETLADRDDQARIQPFDKVEPEKYPWGSIRWLMSAKIDPRAEMTLGLVHFEPHQTNTLHIHPNSAEFLHVISGASEHLVDGQWLPLKPGDTLRIPKNVPHQARTQDQAFDALIVYDTPNRVMVPVK